MDKKESSEREVDLLEYWGALVRRKKLIGMATAAGFVLSLAVSFVLPKSYVATARVFPPEKRGGGGLAAAILSGVPGNLAGLAGSLMEASSSVDLWAEILESRGVSDNIIKRFNLDASYGGDTHEDTLGTLHSRVDIEVSKAGVLSVSVQDRDPGKAADMANAFVDELDRVNRETVNSTGRRTRMFVEKQLDKTKENLKAAEDEMLAFKEKYGAVQLDKQAEAVVTAISEAKGKLMAKEVELNTLRSFATDENPKVAIIRAQIAQLKDELEKLQAGDLTGGVILPTGKLPELGVKYVRLLRELKIQETLFEMLTAQYEQARIQEAKDSPTVQVMDAAQVPTKKAKPRRSLIVAMSTLASLVAAMLAAVVLESGAGTGGRDS